MGPSISQNPLFCLVLANRLLLVLFIPLEAKKGEAAQLKPLLAIRDSDTGLDHRVEYEENTGQQDVQQR